MEAERPQGRRGDFLDHGPHIVDFLRWVGGDISHVSGETRVLVPGRNEDYTRCFLKFASGATASITTTLYDFKSDLYAKVYMTVRGTRGRIDLVLPNVDKFKPARRLHLYREPSKSAPRLLRALGLFKGTTIKLEKNRVFEDQLDYFISTILGGRTRHPVFGEEFIAATGEDGRYTIRVVELVYEAARCAPEWLEVS